MIVALLALFVAMGGTGYAVTSLPKRSVGPAQLRRNAVRTDHIKAGAITSAKLAKSTLNSLRSPVATPSLAGGSGATAAASPVTASPTTPGPVAYADKAGFANRAALADRATQADDAAAADTAAVADNAKLAENASKLGGKSVAEFLTSDRMRWIPPFTTGETTGEGQKFLEVGPFTLSARCTLDATIGGIPNQDQADIIIATTQDNSAFDGEDLLGKFDENKDVEARQFVNTAVALHGQAKFEASSDGLAIGGDGVLYIRGSYLFAGVNISDQKDKCRFGGYVFL
jgi:hypothetical protein